MCMNCLHCQTPLIIITNKFCSQSCSASHNNKGVRRHFNPDNYRPCKTCNKIIHMSKRRVYCSGECNPKKLKLTLEEKQLRHKSMHNEAWHRYMAKKKNQTPNNVDIKELQNFYLNCPKGYEVDHIIPISKGGLHCIENLQYLTISENRKKSNKIL